MSTNQLQHVLEEINSDSSIALAVFDTENLTSLYENTLFSNWFPPSGLNTLDSRIPKINIERLKKRIAKGGNYTVQHEIKFNNRSKIIQLWFSLTESKSLFIRGVDYSKEKELEYLLDSYTKLSENNKRKLEKSIKTINEQKDELIKINSELERERNNIELRALQAIINPHFVSNCLASIQSFIVDNNIEMSVNYLSFFGKLMRMSFEQSYHDYVSIAEIIQLLNTYVSIERIRIDHSWEFVLDIDKKLDIENSKIPPLLIQPFLENAIWHGINDKKEGAKIITTFKMIDEITLKCIIEDNGAGRKTNREHKTKNKQATLHSINVTGKRLDILWQEYNKTHEIIYTDLKDNKGNPCGTRLELQIPINF